MGTRWYFNPFSKKLDMTQDITPTDIITSTPGSGEYEIEDIRLDATKKIVVKYNDVAEV